MRRKHAFKQVPEQKAQKREAAATAGEKEDAPRRERKPRPTTPRRKEGAERKPVCKSR
ncbi:hypothetical protein ACLK1S_11460 [Escherichia coli]